MIKRHPAEYSTVPFYGMHVMEVDAGTNITDERTGEAITVDDETVAVKGRVLFCTAKVFDAMKNAAKPAYCEACDGSGVEVYGITVYEPGCGFSHDSTDERPCRLCDGSGMQPLAPVEPDSPPYPVKMNEGDLPF